MREDRCGALGIIVQTEGIVGVEVRKVIAETKIRNIVLPLAIDLSVGMFIPMEILSKEQRLLFLFENEEYKSVLDYGEIGFNQNSSVLIFISDMDDGIFSNASVDKLVGKIVEITCEIYSDHLGAYGRLKEFKKLFRSQ